MVPGIPSVISLKQQTTNQSLTDHGEKWNKLRLSALSTHPRLSLCLQNVIPSPMHTWQLCGSSSVIDLLPLFLSARGNILLTTNKLQRYELLFLSNLGINASQDSMLTRKLQGRSWLITVCQWFQAYQSSSVLTSSFISSPGPLDLFIKSLSSLSATEYHPGPVASMCCCNRRQIGRTLPHMLGTSYFLRMWWNHSRQPCACCWFPSSRHRTTQWAGHRPLNTNHP